MTDIILKDILDILQQKYYAIVIVDQNIKESISACKVQDQLQVQNNNGKSNVTTNEQDVLQEMCDQVSSQVTEKTVIDAIDDEEDDIVECPFCNKSAMSGVIQCEECWMWLHYECAGINEDKVSRITNSSQFICICCNDQKLYEETVVNDDIHPAPPQEVMLYNSNTPHISNTRVKENLTPLRADDKVDKDELYSSNKVKQSNSGLGKVGHIDTSCKVQANSDSGSCPKQTGVNKNKSTKANVSLKRK